MEEGQVWGLGRVGKGSGGGGGGGRVVIPHIIYSLCSMQTLSC